VLYRSKGRYSKVLKPGLVHAKGHDCTAVSGWLAGGAPG
jgi:hypothetical protein